MALDYVKLRDELGATLKELSPRSVQMSQDDLYAHFRKKMDQAEGRLFWRKRGDERAFILAGVASVVAISGLAVAGSAAAPMAVGFMVGGGGIAAARVITSVILRRRDQDQRIESRGMLFASVDAQRRAFERDSAGGFFKRLYNDMADRFKRYGTRVEQLIDRIDGIRAENATEYAGAAKRALEGSLSPGFVDYLQRTSLDRDSASAHLLARLSTIKDLAVVNDGMRADPPGSQPSRGRMALDGMGVGGFRRGLMSSLSMPARSVNAPAAPARAETQVAPTYYGFIRASEHDGDFIRSFGVELGRYDSKGGGFNAKASPEGYARIQPLNGMIGTIEMRALDSALKDAQSVDAKIPLARMSEAQLEAYGHCLSFEAVTATAADQGNAARVSARLAVFDEWRRREAAERRPQLATGAPAVSEGLEI